MDKSHKASIIYFNNGSGLGSVLSGGTIRHLETLRVASEKHLTHVVTSTGGYKNYIEENVKPSSISVTKTHLWKSEERNNMDRVISYIVLTLHSFFRIIIKKLPKGDLAFVTSDYLCDVYPSVLYKLIYKSKLVFMVHHTCKSPLQRSGNLFFNTVSYLFQRLSFLLIKFMADAVFVYDTPEGESIINWIKPKKVYKVRNGLDLSRLEGFVECKKTYDACFGGGLRETKGIYDVLKIWTEVVKTKPSAKIAVAGGGTKEITEDLIQRITDLKLQDNIIILGPLDQTELFGIEKSSTIFLSASHEEGWGMAVLEAVALGLSVVAYKLPAFTYLNEYIYQVEMYDYIAAANKIIEILDNKDRELKKTYEGIKFAKQFDWVSIGRSDIRMLEEVLSEI